jgi:hypothetical protein
MRLLLGAALLCAACDKPPNYLEGSISESHDLSFDAVSLRYLPDQQVFQLAYFKALDAGADTVAKITFNEPAGGVVPNQPISLIAPEADAVVERVTAAGDTFPPTLREGQFLFFNDDVVNETVRGEFASTFDNGKTLNGGYEAVLKECSFDIPCE